VNVAIRHTPLAAQGKSQLRRQQRRQLEALVRADVDETVIRGRDYD
jgi:hypothetical protein